MSEEIDQETQEKQNYLRIKIMDAGYDPNVFVEFLINKKGEAGADVANWSLPDLKNVVQEFINLNNNTNNNNNNNNNNNATQVQNNNKTQNEQNNNINEINKNQNQPQQQKKLPQKEKQKK